MLPKNILALLGRAETPAACEGCELPQVVTDACEHCPEKEAS